MKVYLSRWTCLDVDSNLLRMEEEARDAAATGAGIVVFPELFLTGYQRQLEPARGREIFARISAAAPSVLFLFGSISEAGYNRMLVYTGGDELAHYDKVHLFHPNREHERWQRGERYVALQWQGHCIGLLNCNDIRFPEQARALCLEARADILVTVAWWPWRRDHVLATLMRARALENAVWMLGCCVAGSVFQGEDFAGAGNHVFDPAGEPVRTVDDRIYEIDLANPPEAVVNPLAEYVAVQNVART
jgi:predicted amidohydrolase